MTKWVLAVFVLYSIESAGQDSDRYKKEFDRRVLNFNFSIDSTNSNSIFSIDEIERMKQFFLRNTALPEQPKLSRWSKMYRHKCINTVRAGLEILLFGKSSIPDSLYSNNPVFNGNFQSNDVQGLATRLLAGGYLEKPDTLLFNAINLSEKVLISKQNSQSRYLRPIEPNGSLWEMLLARIGKSTGYSVFIISLCDGYHTAILTVDHRAVDFPVVYWSDQTHKHPYRYIRAGKVIEKGSRFGWEAMLYSGTDTLKRNVLRGLDNYIQFATDKFWCDCRRENQKPNECCVGNCFPIIQIWRVRKMI